MNKVLATATGRARGPVMGREVGQIVIMTALLFPVLLGFAGFAIDIGLLMVHRTERQRTADAAAIAGAQYLMYNSSQVDAAKQVACDYALKNGYGTGTCPSTEVEVNQPASMPGAIEVIIKRTDNTVFMQYLVETSPTVKARAVATSKPREVNYALIVLEPTKCDSFTTSSNITITGGGMIVNSDATTGSNCIGESAKQNGGSVITAQTCLNKDNVAIECTLDYNPKAKWTTPSNSSASPVPTKAPPFPDPLTCGPPEGKQAHIEDDYCPRPVPCSTAAGGTPTGCVPWSSTSAGQGNKANNPTITQLQGSGEVTLEPGVYFGGLRISSTSLYVRFKPGIYVFAGSDHNGNGGGFNYQSGNLCGEGAAGTCPVATGVTFFNTSNPYAAQSGNRPCSGLSITGSGLLKFAAPTVRHTTPLTGYKNMLFWQNDSCSEEFKFAGSSSGQEWTATGLMYLPEAHMQVTGGGNFGSVQIITKTFNQGGSQSININFTRYVDTDSQQWKLVE